MPEPQQVLTRTPEEHFQAMVDQYGVPVEFARAVKEMESGRQPHQDARGVLTSAKNARGFFQVLPETAAAYGLDANDPFQNIEAGVRNMREAMEKNAWDPDKAFAYYHGGSDLRKHGPLTRAYARQGGQLLRGMLSAQANEPPPKPPVTPPPKTPAEPAAAPPPPSWWQSGAPPSLDPMVRWGQMAVATGREATAALNPRTIWEGIKALPGIARHPVEAAQGLYASQRQLWDEGTAREEAAAAEPGLSGYLGGLEGRVRKSAAMVPLLGPRIAQAQDFFGAGDPASGAGALIDVAGQIATMRGPSGRATIVPPAFKPRLNPKEAAAVAAGRARDPHLVDVATASGSPFALKLQRASEATYAGSPVAETAALTRGEVLPRWAEDLGAGAGPPATPLTAGEAVKGGVQTYIDARQARANRAYDKFRDIEANAPVQQVPVGTTNQWTPQGTLQTVPVLGPMRMPVDLRAAKAQLRPLYDQLTHGMGITQQQASPGLHVLKQVLDGPDFAPASIVERDLGVVKSLARTDEAGGVRTVSQGLASKGVQTLSDAVDAAVAQAGPDARRALDVGREATKAKHGAKDILASLASGKAEDVGAFRQLVQPKDASLGFLKDVQKLAPREIPKVARATLEDIFRTQTETGGWTRATGAFAKWQQLGPETKRILFGAAQTKALDDFFLLGKMLERSPNPSGTALTMAGVGSLLDAVRNPGVGIPTLFFAGQIAKLMHSPAGVKLLTEGLTIPAGSVRATAWAAQVARLAAQEEEQAAGRPPRPPVGTPPPAPPR